MGHCYFKLVAEELTQQTMNFHMAHACMQSSRYLCSSGVGGGGSRVQEFPNIYHMIDHQKEFIQVIGFIVELYAVWL